MTNNEDTSKTFRLVCQLNKNDCGPAALMMVAEYYRRECSMKELTERCRA